MRGMWSSSWYHRRVGHGAFPKIGSIWGTWFIDDIFRRYNTTISLCFIIFQRTPSILLEYDMNIWNLHDHIWLVVTGCHEFYFPMIIGNLILPMDFHIFQRGGPTTNQISNISNIIYVIPSISHLIGLIYTLNYLVSEIGIRWLLLNQGSFLLSSLN